MNKTDALLNLIKDLKTANDLLKEENIQLKKALDDVSQHNDDLLTAIENVHKILDNELIYDTNVQLTKTTTWWQKLRRAFYPNSK